MGKSGRGGRIKLADVDINDASATGFHDSDLSSRNQTVGDAVAGMVCHVGSEDLLHDGLIRIAPVDAVIDTIGGPSQSLAMNVLKPGGILVSTVSRPTTRKPSAAAFEPHSFWSG
ncbi:hypothetical protein ACFPME_01850 [Rhodanobacter umsongensis]|uniref:Alcohol dehydrogenase-like C-terminal domain-containing protein n=1 Tax=Rhodanobacter umsongensis TaxID=633153 RepID=A0ABW0JHL1_9GAMM